MTIIDSLHKCTACGACSNVCPTDAIHFLMNEFGFSYPQIDKNSCIECGKCRDVCPENLIEIPGNIPIKVFAAQSMDEGYLMTSSSGGVFSSIASGIIKNKNGFVFGSRLDITNKKITHIGIYDIGDLPSISGSKYAQSEIGQTFKRVKRLLEKNCFVLFSGTPCQISGLKRFLNKDFDNLLLIDVICHGVPSSSLFFDFLEFLASRFGLCEEFKFRDKKYGWGIIGSYYAKNNRGKKICYDDYAYTYYFKQGEIFRESCYSCKYARNERISDITIGDYWGIERIHPKIAISSLKKGYSLVMANTEKGLDFLNETKECLKLVSTSFEKAKFYNPQLNCPSKNTVNRQMILQQYQDGGYRAIETFYRSTRSFFKWFILKIKCKIAANFRFFIRTILNRRFLGKIQ